MLISLIRRITVPNRIPDDSVFTFKLVRKTPDLIEYGKASKRSGVVYLSNKDER